MKNPRMYGITLRHFIGRQQGIQGWHAGVRYQLKHDDKNYQKWARQNETIVLLETFSDTLLKKAAKQLKRHGVKVSVFHEPDVNNCLTCIAFLIDEEVWNKQKYPLEELSDNAAWLREFISKYPLASG